MANIESRYCHTFDLGQNTTLEHLAIETPYPLTLTFSDSSSSWEIKVGENCIYELDKDITIQSIVVGAANGIEKALFTYKKSGS